MAEELSTLSVAYIAMSYLSLTLFFGGLFYKLYAFATTPSPLKIPLTPQATTAGRLFFYNLTKLSTFSVLFKSNRSIWVGGFSLHLLLLFIFLHHLRFTGFEISAVNYLGILAGFLLPFVLIYILVSKNIVERIRYITSTADRLVLLLLLFTALSGVSLNKSGEADTSSVTQFLSGLYNFHCVNIPDNPHFLFHFSLVLLLFALFPFTTLLHSGAIFFSPPLMQVDDAREKRYVNSMEISDGR